jgi:hypothetical protein
VRVGRSALDEDAIRLIEQHNPGVEFDWTRILKGQDAPPEPVSQPERRPRPRTREFPPPRPVVKAVPEPVPSASPEVRAGARPDNPPAPVPESAAGVEAQEVPAQQPAEIPQTAYVPADEAGGPMTPAQARLGFEGLSRLRARHAEVLARISEKVTDDATRDQLKSEAERLNPDTWVTEAEVTAGLESYESVFESMRGVVGRRRKRRGGPSGAPPDALPAEAAETLPSGGDAPDEPREDT